MCLLNKRYETLILHFFYYTYSALALEYKKKIESSQFPTISKN